MLTVEAAERPVAVRDAHSSLSARGSQPSTCRPARCAGLSRTRRRRCTAVGIDTWQEGLFDALTFRAGGRRILVAVRGEERTKASDGNGAIIPSGLMSGGIAFMMIREKASLNCNNFVSFLEGRVVDMVLKLRNRYDASGQKVK
jgi:hypothetical protein